MPAKTSLILALPIATALLTASPAMAVPAEAPEAFVRRVYARYAAEDGPGVLRTRPEGAQFYLKDLLDAYAKDVASGGGATVDWDPICACQAYKLRLRTVTVTRRQPDAAEARVAFTKLGSRATVLLTLSHTPVGWRISDVANSGVKSIAALLIQSAARSDRTTPRAKP